MSLSEAINKRKKLGETSREAERDLESIDFSLPYTSSGGGGLNTASMVDRATGKSEYPDDEPEHSWIKDLERMKVNTENFEALLKKYSARMGDFERYRNSGWEWRYNYLMRYAAYYRPEILKALGYKL